MKDEIRSHSSDERDTFTGLEPSKGPGIREKVTVVLCTSCAVPPHLNYLLYRDNAAMRKQCNRITFHSIDKLKPAV